MGPNCVHNEGAHDELLHCLLPYFATSSNSGAGSFFRKSYKKGKLSTLSWKNKIHWRTGVEWSATCDEKYTKYIQDGLYVFFFCGSGWMSQHGNNVDCRNTKKKKKEKNEKRYGLLWVRVSEYNSNVNVI